MGLQFFKDNVQDNYFYTSDEVERLITEAENTFAICLEGGDKSKAMKKLRVPPLGGKVGRSTYAARIHTHVCMRINTYIHTYIHTYTCMRACTVHTYILITSMYAKCFFLMKAIHH